MSEPTPLRPVEVPEPAKEDLTDSVWLKAVMQLAESQAKAQETQTDRIVEAFQQESKANRAAVGTLQKESREGLAEVRSVVNRNTMALVVVALVGFASVVAIAAGQTMGLTVGPDGLTVHSAESIEP